MTAAALAAAAGRRTEWALGTARWAALFAVIGAAATPPLVSAAEIVMIVSFFLLPDWRERLQSVRRQPIAWGWLALVAVLLLAALYGLLLGVPARRVGVALFGWRHLLLVPLGLALFDEPQAQRRFAIGFVAFAAIAALGSLAALYVGFTKSEPYPGVILRNQVTQAMAFAAAALFALVMASADRSLPRRLRLALGLAGLGLVAVLAFTQAGRSGFVALVAGAVTVSLVALRGRARLLALVGLPLLVAMLVMASPRLQARFAMGLSELRNAAQLPEYTSMGIRVVIWQTTVELIEARPLLGYGLGGFPPAYATRIAQKYSEGWRSVTTQDAHNQYLYLWAEAGLPGLAAFAAFLIAAWRQRPASAYGVLGVGLLMAWCTTSLFSSHFQAFNESHLIAVFLGVFLARERSGLLQPSAAITVASTSS